MPFVKGQPGGPGRRPKAQKFARPIARAEKQIADKLPTLIEKALELAEGVFVEDINIVTLTKSVYQKPPDLSAIKYLVDRIMGKPTEHHELTGADGGPILTEVYDYNTAIAALASRSGEDSDPSGEDSGTGDGPEVGEEHDGGSD